MNRIHASLTLVAGVIALVACACGSAAPAAPNLVTPTEAPAVTESPLVVEETTPKPVDSTKPTGNYYKPPGWNGSSDVNCSDFDTRAHAQSFFKGTGGSKSKDLYGLDGDHDAAACETLP